MHETISFENLEKYRSFDSVAEMDAVIYSFIDTLRKDEQPESVIEVLRFLGRSSLRVTGVSFAKYQTIADSIGMSVSTVKRAMCALKGYGMIECVPTVKRWGFGRGKSRRKSVNIVRILAELSPQAEPTAEDEKPTPDKESNAGSPTEPFNFKHNNSYVLEPAELERHAIRNNNNYRQIPPVLYNMLAPFFRGKELRKYVGIVFRAKAHPHVQTKIEAHEEAFKACLADCIRRYKQGAVRSLESYLYASVRRLARRLALGVA